MLMDRYKEAVYWHIRRLVVSHDDAEDAAQETFIRIFRSVGRFRGDSSLKTWIYRIATNEALRTLERRREGQVAIDTPGSGVNAMPADEYTDYSDLEGVRLQKAIRSLPAGQQLVFNLRYYDELSYNEIARITEMSAASAKTSYHIAKGKIWERAKNEGIIDTASGAGTAIKAGEPSEMPGGPDNHAPGAGTVLTASTPAGKREHRRARSNHALLRPVLIGSAAAAAVIVAFSAWLCNIQTVKMSDIESAFESLSYEDRTHILETYRSDIFLYWN